MRGIKLILIIVTLLSFTPNHSYKSSKIVIKTNSNDELKVLNDSLKNEMQSYIEFTNIINKHK